MKQKLNLMSMEELDRLVRHPETDEHLRERALNELQQRESKPFGVMSSRVALRESYFVP